MSAPLAGPAGRSAERPDGDKLDLVAMQAVVDEGGDQVVSEGWLKQCLKELQEGRAALARTGQLFGLPVDIRL